MKERKVFTKVLSEQYRKAAKKQKGDILKQVVESTGYTRCYARWVLRNHGRRVEVQPGLVLEGDRRIARKRQCTPRYGPAAVEALTKIWKILDCICGKRLAGALPEVVPRLAAFKEIRITKAVQRQLLDISAATIDRLLKPERARYTLKGRGRTRPVHAQRARPNQTRHPAQTSSAGPDVLGLERRPTGLFRDGLGRP